MKKLCCKSILPNWSGGNKPYLTHRRLRETQTPYRKLFGPYGHEKFIEGFTLRCRF